MTTHGMSRSHALYAVWRNMKDRCYNKNNKRYHVYGGKGIKLYKNWKNDFMKFYNWAIKNNWTKDLTIDRIDNNKDYCPQNCHFITRSENSSKTFIDNPGYRTGTNNPRALLTENQVRKIKKMIEDGFKNCIIAKQMNIHRNKVSQIKLNKIWKHIK